MRQPLETRDVIGRCFVLSQDLRVRDELDGGEWKFCEGRPQGHDRFGFCQQGLAAAFSPDQHYILFGAPGTYNWKGERGQAPGGAVRVRAQRWAHAGCVSTWGGFAHTSWGVCTCVCVCGGGVHVWVLGEPWSRVRAHGRVSVLRDAPWGQDPPPVLAAPRGSRHLQRPSCPRAAGRSPGGSPPGRVPQPL